MGVPLLPIAGQPAPMGAAEFIAASVANKVTFAFNEVQPPSRLYLQRDDVLCVQACSATAGEIVNVNYRLLLAPYPQGGQPDAPPAPTQATLLEASNQVDVGAMAIPLPVALTPVLVTRVLSEGYLLSLGVSCTQAAARGQTFVRVFIVRGPQIVGNAALGLVADYVLATSNAAWPGGRFASPTEGPGFMVEINQGNPAPGADFNIIVPQNTRWRLQSLAATFTAAAAVANRNPQLQLSDGSVHIAHQGACNGNIVATTVAVVSIVPSLTLAALPATTFQMQCPINPMLQALWKIATLTANIQPADQWSNIWGHVEQWLDF